MSDATKQLETLLHDQPLNPMRPNVRRELEDERDRLRTIVTAPVWQTGADRGQATKRFKQIEKTLANQAPKAVTGARQDQVKAACDEVLGEIREAMLPQSVMRRNPAGAVDEFRRREGSKAVKRKISQWKRGMWALDPTNEDSDYTNLERFRPSGLNENGVSTYMLGAQIPGKFAMSPQAKDNWPLGPPTADTALKQVQRAETSTTTMKREMSDKQKAALLRAQAARRAKIATSHSTPSQEVPTVAVTG